MPGLPDNELLSAYLDGELTAAEQAETERLLAENPAARQLLEELRAVSHSLQSLPAQKLSEDLREQVLRIAKRRMQTEAAPPVEEPAPLPRPFAERWKNPRLWIWPAITVAVAVLLVVFSPGPRELKVPHDHEVALVKQPEEVPGGNRARETNGRILPSDGKEGTESLPALTAPPATPAPTLHAGSLAEKAAEKPDERQLRFGIPESKERELSEPQTMAKYPAGRDEFAKKAPPPAAAATPSPAEPAKGGETIINLNAAGQKAEHFQEKRGKNADHEEVPSGGGLLVVQCDIPVKAQPTHPFDELLKTQGIHLVDTDQAGGMRMGGMGGMGRGTVDRLEKKLAEQRPSAGEDITRVQGPASPRETPPLDLVYVEAPATQVENLLTALVNDKKNYTAVQVIPDPNQPDQQNFLQYNRDITDERLRTRYNLSTAESKPAGAAAEFGELQTVKPQTELSIPPPAGSPNAFQTAKGMPAQQFFNYARRIPLPQRPADLEDKLVEEARLMNREIMQQAPKSSVDSKLSGKAGFALAAQNAPLEQTGAVPTTQRVLFILRTVENHPAAKAAEVTPPAPAEKAKIAPAKP